MSHEPRSSDLNPPLGDAVIREPEALNSVQPSDDGSLAAASGGARSADVNRRKAFYPSQLSDEDVLEAVLHGLKGL